MPRSTVSTKELVLVAIDDEFVVHGRRAGADSEQGTWERNESSHVPSDGVVAQRVETAFWHFTSEWVGVARLPRDYDTAARVLHLQAVFVTAFATAFSERRVARLAENAAVAMQ